VPPTAGSSTVEVHLSGGRPSPAFYFDLGVPESYLTAERVLQVMPVATEWIPVALGGGDGEVDWAALSALAEARGLQPVRPPAAFPFDPAFANRTATYAKQIGRAVAFGLAAFRQAYAGGRDLSVPDNVLIAASACEMHPAAILRAVETRSVRDALARATAQAVERGVLRTPAIWTGTSVHHGDAALEDAAAVLAERAA
jgi:2-hydroxychromene-2-carboxylate isomerase